MIRKKKTCKHCSLQQSALLWQHRREGKCIVKGTKQMITSTLNLILPQIYDKFVAKS